MAIREITAVLPPFDPWHCATAAFDVLALQRGPRRNVLATQTRRLAALLEWATARSAPYRQRLGRRTVARVALPALEPVTKAELMERFDEWVTDPRVRLDDLLRFVADPACIGGGFGPGYAVWTSSGTNGAPGLFVQDAKSMAVYDALEALRRPGWPAARHLMPRVAFVGATTGHFASTVSMERLRRLAPGAASFIRGFSFLLAPQELARALEDFAPDVVATYPTTALVLATMHRAGRLSIMPTEIWTGGETLTPGIRHRLERDFHCRVSNSYGASEFLTLASECRCGQLHLNEDWVILEPVDEHHVPVPQGQTGWTTLMTNLANYLQPIIRYDIGDRVSLHGACCPCGSPLAVVKVQGRSDDLLLLRDERRHQVAVPPLAVTTVLEEDAGLFDFELEQTGESSLEIRSSRADRVGRAVLAGARTALRRYLARQGLRKVQVNAVCGACMARDSSGKLRRIVDLRRHRAINRSALGDGSPRARRHRARKASRTEPATDTGTGRSARIWHKDRSFEVSQAENKEQR